MKKIQIELTKDEINKLTKKSKSENLTNSQYILKLINLDLNSTVNLGNGFYFNKYLDKLFDENNKEIQITKISKNLLLTLIEYEGKTVPVETLMMKVWKRKDVSIYAFRNIISKIRDKTYYQIIKSHSGVGYSVNLNFL